ncbi:MAG TPA: hypothetical protein VK518_21320 [Puia sp.]|nr:hypothetical protein [Puia sp.]
MIPLQFGLLHARYLLKDTLEPIQSVASLCGFKALITSARPSKQKLAYHPSNFV